MCVCAGLAVRLVTRAVTQAHLAYGISFFFLPRRGKHSGEARRAVKHTAQARSPCGPTQGGHTQRTPVSSPNDKRGHSAPFRKS